MNFNHHSRLATPLLMLALACSGLSCSDTKFAGHDATLPNTPKKSDTPVTKDSTTPDPKKNTDTTNSSTPSLPTSPVPGLLNGTPGGTPTSVPAVDFNAGDPSIITQDGTVQAKRCSAPLTVPGTANPYLAGAAGGTEILSDTAPQQSAPEVIPNRIDCLSEGSKLSFDVSGQITFDPGESPTSADGRFGDNGGNQAFGGKSGFVAPMNSLVGVFTGDVQGSGLGDFASFESQNRKTYSPALGSIFFIGDGKASDGTVQTFIVPRGAKHLYLGVSDRFEWNDNSGQLTGSILWRPR